MHDRARDAMDHNRLKISKNGVQDTQEHANIDKRGGGKFYNDHRDNDDEFSDDEDKDKRNYGENGDMKD